jgi:hypothetical protein
MTEPFEMESFREPAAQQQRLVRRALRLYAEEVDAILRSRCTEPKRIEQQLDALFGFCFDADMLLLFKKLCRHYFRIDPRATAEYVRFYREMWAEEPEAGDGGTRREPNRNPILD